MPLISTRVEIAATPVMVRAKFLHFDQIPTYSAGGFVHTISSADGKIPADLVSGDKLDCIMGGGSMKFSPILIENSSRTFSWRGSLLGMFVGEHSFRFEPSEQNPNGTVFVHEEEFSGVLSWMMGQNWLAQTMGQRESTRKGFEGFNQDFKTWVEHN